MKPQVRAGNRQPDAAAAAQSMIGEEDPGAALDIIEPATADRTRSAGTMAGAGTAPRHAGYDAARGAPATAGSMCHRCGGSGRVGVALCPTCGGSGKMIRGLGGG